jgi:Holliday junction DNA helicase RuvB
MIGQGDALRQIRTIVDDALESGDDALPHMLIAGPSGTGKTTVAYIIAGLKDTKLHTLTPSGLRVVQDVAAALNGKVRKGDIVFIDEAQDLPKTVQNAFLVVMEDGWLSYSVGQGKNRRVDTVQIPPFTLILGTTNPAKLNEALRGRCWRVDFTRYREDEISTILQRAADKRGISMTTEAADKLAMLARGTARRATKTLLMEAKAQARLHAKAIGPDPETGELPTVPIDADVVDSMIENFQYDWLGLKEIDRRYVRALAIDEAGGPIGIEKLAQAAGLDISEAKDLEPWLIACRLMWVNGSGRWASANAYQFLGQVEGNDALYVPMPTTVSHSRTRPGGPWIDEDWYNRITS